ncbi:MAG: signal peptidase I [Candidatus Paceibacterota bacterium]|jgi:signal peptidase I
MDNQEEKNNSVEVPNAKNEIVSNKTTPKPKSIWRELIEFIVLAVIIVVPFRIFIAQPFLVSGPSMDPTFDNGNYLIVDEISYRFEELKRGEVIIFKFPTQLTRDLIKRIIGLPGETVILDGETIKIVNSENPNGFLLNQDFIQDKNKMSDEKREIKLASDEYFVMGDNRLVSSDSRSWGPLKKNLIIGRPLFRLYPFSRIGLFPGDESDSIGRASTTPSTN